MDKYGFSIVQSEEGFEAWSGSQQLGNTCETFEHALNKILIPIVINLEYRLTELAKMWPQT